MFQPAEIAPWKLKPPTLINHKIAVPTTHKITPGG